MSIIGNAIMLSGGGSLLMTVVGGTTQPATPDENTIWVNTSTAIGNWCVSNTEPSSPSAGDVWITLKPSISNTINIVESNDGAVYLGFGTAWQYISGAWENKDAELYTNGAWQELNFYAYNLGDLCTAETGGWELYKATNNLNTFEDTYLNHDYKSTSSYKGIFVTDNTIDVTEYTHIYMDYEVISAGNTGANYTGGLYFTTNNTGLTAAENAATDIYTFHVASQARTVVSVDIASYTGSYYIMTKGNYQKWKCYRIWLTK